MENIELKVATLADLHAIIEVGDDLFDNPVKVDRATEFLSSQRQHLAIAMDGNKVIGMASGFHYVHPDKNPTLFIDEVGVIDSHQGKGIGRNLVSYLCDHAKSLGCDGAWVLTEQTNAAAKGTYEAANGIACSDELVLYDFSLAN